MLNKTPTDTTSDVLLEVSHLSKSFGGVAAVQDVSLQLRSGVVTTLVGPNGAGKTTLFNLITGHIVPDSGEVRWKGDAILGLKPWEIARNGICRTFQDLRLFSHMSVADNVLTVMEQSFLPWQPGGFSQARARRERVAQILEETHLADKAYVRAVDLSYAERKFLSLARIMATDGEIWLLDEPASGLDPRSFALFVDLLKANVKRGITVCIIEHNLDIVISLSDRVAFLDRGKLLAEDDPDTILKDPHLVAIYFGERN
ncbi:ABC transporter ATP-binding protein [Rhodobacteraceae bacterium NNCM2]|nr:ABC transporter ATP-binding protein [Coraliihabitans acroporae]